MKILNYTPHAITLCGGIYASEGIARVKMEDVKTSPININEKMTIPTFAQKMGEVEGLPEPTEGTIYIVSSLVLAAVGERGNVGGDCYAPTRFVRDGEGNIIGAEGLYQL